MPAWLNQLLPILLILGAVFVVLGRLPRVELGHTEAYKRRRFLNWFPLGMTYAFLYMGRYNLSANASLLDQAGILTKEQFGVVDGWGSAVYGVAFLLNGPLTDRWGGRVTILLAAGGSAVMNALMGLMFSLAMDGSLGDKAALSPTITVLFCANMYFQSFGAVSIVKVNAPWFHVRERGVLGGVFGILISLGLYFAYDWSRFIARSISLSAAFLVPALILLVFTVVDTFLIRDTPSAAGHPDFDTADASSGDNGPPLGVLEVARRMFSQRVIIIIVGVEFCSGFLRNAIMKWYLVYADKIGEKAAFVAQNWGVLLCIAGIMGGVFAGFISDHVFDSRRGPVASVLYGGLVVGGVMVTFALGSPVVAWTVVFMSLCVIGVHGMLSGTASMDFGGRKNAGVVTGIIDGFVYLGTAAQSFLYARILPHGADAANAANWISWPVAMLPVAAVGLVLATRVWNARPQGRARPA
ncbi:MAG: MFS transporter [Deltaproteobacteria bacterium]|nr:MFS transporter [Deltaproteobacteria bacterium]